MIHGVACDCSRWPRDASMVPLWDDCGYPTSECPGSPVIPGGGARVSVTASPREMGMFAAMAEEALKANCCGAAFLR